MDNPVDKTSESPRYGQQLVNVIIGMLIIWLTVYVISVEFDGVSLAWALLLTVVGVLFYRERLHEFVNDETLYWTMLAALGLFMTSFSTAADLSSMHLVLAATFITAVISMWTKATFFVLMTAFLTAYIAFRLLFAHLP